MLLLANARAADAARGARAAPVCRRRRALAIAQRPETSRSEGARAQPARRARGEQQQSQSNQAHGAGDNPEAEGLSVTLDKRATWTNGPLCCPWTPPAPRAPTAWWEEGEALPNLVSAATPHALAKAMLKGAMHGSRLTVLCWYGRQCPGCKALHPKLHQIAMQNPSVTFVRVEFGGETEALAKAMGIRLLPFTQFFGPEGLHETMACSLAPDHLKRFRKALEKYTPWAEESGVPHGFIANALPDELQQFLEDGDITARQLASVEWAREHLEVSFFQESED